MDKPQAGLSAASKPHVTAGGGIWADPAGDWYGSGLLVAGALIISFAPVLVRVASVGPTMAGFYRTAIGAIVLLLIAGVSGNRPLKVKRRLSLAGLSAVFFALGLTFWHRSIHAVGPGVATILANFQVFFLAAIGVIFLKERVRIGRLAAMILAVAGVCLLVGVGRVDLRFQDRAGIAFGLSAALAYALYVTVLRRLQQNAATGEAAANFAVVSLLCACFMGIEGRLQGETFLISDGRTWLAVIALGVFCQALGWVMISKGLPKVAASRAGIFLLLQPTGAFFWDVLLLNRPTDGATFFGATLALASIYFGARK